MYSSSSAKLLLHTPQRPNARGLALFDILLSLAGGEGHLHSKCGSGSSNSNPCGSGSRSRTLCWAASHCQFQLLIYSTWALIIISTQIMHGMQGQYSRVPMLPHMCEFLNSGTHCGMGYTVIPIGKEDQGLRSVSFNPVCSVIWYYFQDMWHRNSSRKTSQNHLQCSC